MYQKNAFLCPCVYFTLQSRINWTCAIQPVIAQSVQYSKIAKKLNIDCRFVPIFFSSKGSTDLIKIMKLKMQVTVLIFAV